MNQKIILSLSDQFAVVPECILEHPKPPSHLHIPAKLFHELAGHCGLNRLAVFQPATWERPNRLMDFALQENLALAKKDAAGPGAHGSA